VGEGGVAVGDWWVGDSRWFGCKGILEEFGLILMVHG